MLKKLILLTVVMAVLLLGVPVSLFAGTTGKISGAVKDVETGEVLPGVNVVIEGSAMGAVSDIEGNYFIINIPPGLYSLKASMVGYTTVTVTDVEVRIDITTPVNFDLQQQVLDVGGEVTVTAEREVVRMDVSYTQTNLSADMMQSVPAAFRLNDALASQVGVGLDDQGLTIRRSNNTEIGYFIDGVSTRDDRMDRDMTYVSRTNVTEVQLLTGAFGAEYGNAGAGIVNVVTTTPKQKYFMNFEGRYSPLIGGDDPDFPGLKHFGSYVYSTDNWWEYGRYDWNNGQPSEDRDGNGKPDFEGWNSWATKNKYSGQTITAEQAWKIWQWQHRSEDDEGNIYYDGKKIGTIESMYESATTHTDAVNWYGFDPDYNMDVTFGGPVPLTGGKVGFVLSHLREYSMNPFFTTNNATNKYNTTQLKLLYNLKPEMKLTLSGIYTDFRTFDFSDPTPRSGFVGQSVSSARSSFDRSQRIFAYESLDTPKGIWYAFLNLNWTHTLSPKTFYEVKLQNTNIDYNQIPQLRARNLGTVYTVGPILLDEAPKGWAYNISVGSDILGIFDMRQGREHDFSYTKSFRVASDITSQINIHHQIKAGFEATYQDLYENRGFSQNYLFHTNEAYRNGPDGQWGTDDDRSPGDQANFHDVHVFPWRGGAYMQDRMEYGGMILNVGMRMDVHKPHHDWYDRNDLFIPNNSALWAEWKKRWGPGAADPGYYGKPADTTPATQVKFSPRLGISHPIGPESKIFFNYGHFYDVPASDYMYQQQLGIDESMENLGNPWLQMLKTIQFEAGYEQRIYGDYVVNVRGYYKDIKGDLDETTIYARDGDGDYFINAIGRDIKGVEIQLEKKYGQFVTGFINADYNNEKVSNYGWTELYHPEATEALVDPTYMSWLRVVGDPFINSQVPGSWEVKVNLSLHTPQNWGPGPVIGGSKLLGWWQLDLFHRFRQGDPYNWNPESLQSLQGVYNYREKDFNWTQMHLEKRFKFAGITAGAFMEITNLFNVKNLYSTEWRRGITSRAEEGDRNKLQRAYMDAIIKEGKKLGDETDDPNLMPKRLYYFWGEPRDYWFGLRLFF